MEAAATSNKSAAKWPVMPGTYQVGDPKGSVAVCALTSERLIGPLVALPGVAIAGMVYTANLGIIRIIINITSNPAIRFLLICGKDSALFKPGQSLVALAEKGVDEKRRIIDAAGYDPVLQSIDPEQVTQFRKQVEVLDWTGEENLHVLQERVTSLSYRNPSVFVTGQREAVAIRKQKKFVPIRPGGQREPLLSIPKDSLSSPSNLIRKRFCCNTIGLIIRLLTRCVDAEQPRCYWVFCVTDL